VPALSGYRGMGPVRRGNLAWVQRQHDVYGSVVLASTQLFFDQRLPIRATSTRSPARTAGRTGLRPARRARCGLWEFRGRTEVHTYTAAMCWAACDRLAKIAVRLQRRARQPLARARRHHPCAHVGEAWNAELGHFTDTFGGHRLDASLLLLADIGFIDAGTRASSPPSRPSADAPARRRAVPLCGAGRFRHAGNQLHHLHVLVHRRAGRDRPHGRSARCSSACWRRNHLGLLSEDLAFGERRAWGNFPQTYSHVGLINAAMRLSRSWQEAS
jgi:GH15 family glucan-1,4-alpha-glucosidase